MPPAVPPLPANRDEIFCSLCKRFHGDPRFCRNHSKGKLYMCVRCGRTTHLFEKCWYGNADIDDRAFFLYDCRQGLGPVATTLDCSHIVATPGVHVRDVLTVDQTREIFNKIGRPYWNCPPRELDYSQFGTIQEEAMRVPATPQTGRGPPPSLHTRIGDVHLLGTFNDLVLRITRPRPDADNRMPFGPMRTPQSALRDHGTGMSLSRAQLREVGHLQWPGIKTEMDIDAPQKAPKVEDDGIQSPIIKTERDDP
ncbi:hypothetical protein F4860DRAFT_172517 [Xylaria cubensis]|nr:hypothetical protein F4860DRAFT_172517 [Xylaria cubensis]